MLIQILSPHWWLDFLGQAWRWHVATVFLGLLVFPLAFPALRKLPDAGYAVARILGAFLLTYVNWMLCQGAMAFSQKSLWVSLAVLGGASALCAAFHAGALVDFLRRRWKWVLCAEALALVLFLALLNIRTYCSDINYKPAYHGAEKLGNMMFLSTLYRAAQFPCEDAWFAQEFPVQGEPAPIAMMNYYYGSHMQWATLARFTNYPPEMAFNLALATLFSWFGLGAFGLVLNLTRSLRAGVAAAFLLVFAGNLEPLDQLPYMVNRYEQSEANRQATSSKARDDENPFGEKFEWGRFMQGGQFDLWRASSVILRIVSEDGDSSRDTVNEFPYFSFILGDLHAHTGALPLTLVLLHCLLALYYYKGESAVSWAVAVWRSPWAFGILCLLAGGLYWFNTWEVIPLGLLLLAFFVWDRDDWQMRGVAAVGWGLLLTAAAVGLGVFFFLLPFKMYFAMPLEAPIWSIVKLRPSALASGLDELWLYWGLIWLPLLAVLSRFLLARAPRPRLEPPLGLLTGLSILIGLATIVAYGGMAAASWVALVLAIWAPLFIGLARQLRAKLRGVSDGQAYGFVFSIFLFGASLIGLYRAGFAWPFCLALTLGWGWQAWSARETETQRFASRLALAGFLIVFAAEAIYIDDSMGERLERYNTVFKLYYPAWAFLTIAAVTFVWMELQALRDAGRHVARRLVLAGAAALVAMGLLYPYFATWARTDGFLSAHRESARGALLARNTETKQMRTLRGMDYLADPVESPDEWRAIRWLNANVQGQPHILEAAGPAYSEVGRVSAYTGLPTVIGWDNHEGQWRGWEEYWPEISRRKDDVMAIYNMDDLTRAVYLLFRYNVRYVFVGRLERDMYPQADFSRFEKLGRLAFQTGSVVIYEIDRAKAQRALAGLERKS